MSGTALLHNPKYPLELFLRVITVSLETLKTVERGPSKKRVYERVVDYVATFIRGIAA